MACWACCLQGRPGNNVRLVLFLHISRHRHHPTAMPLTSAACALGPCAAAPRALALGTSRHPPAPRAAPLVRVQRCPTRRGRRTPPPPRAESKEQQAYSAAGQDLSFPHVAHDVKRRLAGVVGGRANKADQLQSWSVVYALSLGGARSGTWAVGAGVRIVPQQTFACTSSSAISRCHPPTAPSCPELHACRPRPRAPAAGCHRPS